MIPYAPYGMSDNHAFQCPLTKKEFWFADGDSRKKAFEEQQAHTTAEIRRREELAGRQLTYRELIRSSRTDTKAEGPGKEPVPQEVAAPKPAPEPHPFVKHVYKGLNMPVIVG